MLYKIDTSYNDYETVKRMVDAKKQVIEDRKFLSYFIKPFLHQVASEICFTNFSRFIPILVVHSHLDLDSLDEKIEDFFR